MRLEGKVTLVTGAARNVGRGIATRFAAEGAHVVLVDIDVDAATLLAESLTSQGLSASVAGGDVSDAAWIAETIHEVARTHGSLDVLVNNAVVHVNKGERGIFLKVTPEGWREFMARNLDALFFATRAAAEVMARRRCGSIISISSNGAVQAHRQRIAYDTLKGALEAFTRAVAVDLAPWGVRVNAIRPIAVRDVAAAGSPAEELERRLGAMVPVGRIARPADVAALAVFLATDEAEFITGQVINVDGAMLEQSRPPELELEPVVDPDEVEL